MIEIPSSSVQNAQNAQSAAQASFKESENSGLGETRSAKYGTPAARGRFAAAWQALKSGHPLDFLKTLFSRSAKSFSPAAAAISAPPFPEPHISDRDPKSLAHRALNAVVRDGFSKESAVARFKDLAASPEGTAAIRQALADLPAPEKTQILYLFLPSI